MNTFQARLREIARVKLVSEKLNEEEINAILDAKYPTEQHGYRATATNLRTGPKAQTT